MTAKPEDETPDEQVPLARVNVPLLVVVGAIITVIITVASWTWVVGSQFTDIRIQIQTMKGGIERQLETLTHRFDIQELKMNDRWTETDMRRWAAELSRRNRDMTVPEVGK